jgi:hypothetical protein
VAAPEPQPPPEPKPPNPKPPNPEPPKPPPRTYTLVRASDVVPRAKNWLWKGHLLRGALELLTGVPGLGKSQTQCKLVASATTDQPWPDGAKSEVRGNVTMVAQPSSLPLVAP